MRIWYDDVRLYATTRCNSASRVNFCSAETDLDVRFCSAFFTSQVRIEHVVLRLFLQGSGNRKAKQRGGPKIMMQCSKYFLKHFINMFGTLESTDWWMQWRKNNVTLDIGLFPKLAFSYIDCWWKFSLVISSSKRTEAGITVQFWLTEPNYTHF